METPTSLTPSESEYSSPVAATETPAGSVISSSPGSPGQATIARSPEAVGPINNPQPPQEGKHQTSQDQYSYWSTELFDCFSDVRSCCLVLWCPCIAFGRIAEIVNKGSSSSCTCGRLYLLLCSMGALASLSLVYAAPAITMTVGCHWILACKYRGRLKQNFNMRPSWHEECCTHFWCDCLSLCQEYRELQNRGYDLSLGWEGNKKKQCPSPAMSPPEPSTMNR